MVTKYICKDFYFDPLVGKTFYVRDCLECGKEFTTMYNFVTCSEECRSKRKEAQRKVRSQRFREAHPGYNTLKYREWLANNREYYNRKRRKKVDK